MRLSPLVPLLMATTPWLGCYSQTRSQGAAAQLVVAATDACFFSERLSGRTRRVVWGNAELQPPFSHPAQVSAEELLQLLDTDGFRQLRERATTLSARIATLGPREGLCIRDAGETSWLGAIFVTRQQALVLTRFVWDAHGSRGTADPVQAVQLVP